MNPASLFYSYSHRDESFREELEIHLAILKRQGYISDWHDRRIAPGDNWEDDININLEKAQIILLLVSSNFIASDYCYDTETVFALEQEKGKKAKVIPIILKPCLWQETHFKHLQALPKDGKAITTWQNQDEAWLDITNGILKVAKGLTFKTGRSPISEHAFQTDEYKSDLEELVIQFLKSFNAWYFSPLRITKWGGRQKGFEQLQQYSSEEVKRVLEKLLKENKVTETISQKGNPIYKIER